MDPDNGYRLNRDRASLGFGLLIDEVDKLGPAADATLARRWVDVPNVRRFSVTRVVDRHRNMLISSDALCRSL
jgi:hypothetical protein